MTRAIIALVGALGLAFVWRASELYKDTDLLAYRMVLLIGAGLLVGIGELLLRATRVARLNQALAGLPKKPTQESVEKLAEPLRSFIEARLNGTPQSLGTAVFTTYLLGLLVMMGLLGTFMGLFETLSGAREALSASGDVAALREGLSAPMKGLSRAFGTSATGVACSALLGLAAVFLRRSETRFTTSVTAITSGPLFPWTTAGRQLTALEALAENREALPTAAKALEDAAAGVQKDIKLGIAQATKAIAPLLDRAVTQAADGATKVVESWTRRLEEDAAARSAKDEARRAEFAAANQAMLDRIAAAFEALSARVDERDGKRAQAFDEVVARMDLQSEHATQRLTEHAERVTAFGKEEDARARARIEADTARDARLVQLGEKLKKIAANIDARTDVVVRAVETQLTSSVDRAASGLAPLLDRAVERASEAASQQVERFTERLESEAGQRRTEETERLRVLETAARDSAELLRAEAELRTSEAAERLRVLETAARESAELLRAEAELRTSEAAERLRVLEAEAVHRKAEEAERLRVLGAEAAERRAEAAERLRVLEAEAAERRVEEAGRLRVLEDATLASAELIRKEAELRSSEAADRLRVLEAGERERAELLRTEAELRLSEAADRLRVLEAGERERAELLRTEAELRSSEAMERMRVLESSARESLEAASRELSTVPNTVRSFLVAEEERLRERDKFEAARDARLESLFARIDELAGALEQRSLQHDERALALEAKLDHERAQAAGLLVEKLSFHAASLGEGLDKTAGLVQEAAESVRSGGTELSAVAEMFTSAVDRYRDANEKWLDTLPTIEGALEKKGGGEAIDLLGAYLDQTREVFDHSLAFQRELFAELRALRAAPRELPRTAVPRTIPPAARQTDSDKGPQ